MRKIIASKLSRYWELHPKFDPSYTHEEREALIERIDKHLERLKLFSSNNRL